MRNAFIPAALSGLVLLSACGPRVSAPSLAPRAIEKQPIDLPSTAGEPMTPVDPALRARIEPLVTAAREGDRAFAHQRIETEAAIAKAAGTAQGGEAWIAAQQSLSLLDDARAPVRDAVGSIEAIRSEPANATRGNRVAIEEAASTIEAIDDAEASVVAALGTKLGG